MNNLFKFKKINCTFLTCEKIPQKIRVFSQWTQNYIIIYFNSTFFFQIYVILWNVQWLWWKKYCPITSFLLHMSFLFFFNKLKINSWTFVLFSTSLVKVLIITVPNCLVVEHFFHILYFDKKKYIFKHYLSLNREKNKLWHLCCSLVGQGCSSPSWFRILW